jgi:hypothetical protein
MLLRRRPSSSRRPSFLPSGEEGPTFGQTDPTYSSTHSAHWQNPKVRHMQNKSDIICARRKKVKTHRHFLALWMSDLCCVCRAFQFCLCALCVLQNVGPFGPNVGPSSPNSTATAKQVVDMASIHPAWNATSWQFGLSLKFSQVATLVPTSD